MPAALLEQDVLRKIYIAHNGLITLVGNYPGTSGAKANFKCDAGHTWIAPTNRIMLGHGCPACKSTRLSKKNRTPSEQISKLIAGKFELLSEYSNMNAKADFLCLGCNREINIQLRQACYAPYGCPHCANKGRAKVGGHSKLSILWVDEVAKKLRLKFQHNENGGEALLPLGLSEHRSVTPVDGYNHRYRIICEYDGDYWHKRHDRRTRQYKNTLRRTNRMLELGYIVIHIWGKDYEAGYDGTVLCRDSRGKRVAGLLDAEFIRTSKLEEL